MNDSRVLRRAGPHAVVRNFLGEELVARLLEYAEVSEGLFTQASAGVGGAKRVDPGVRVSRRLSDCGPLTEEIKARLLARVPALIATLGLVPFQPAGADIELVAHGDGAFYKRHLDVSIGSGAPADSRVLSTVYYFYRMPKPFSGGALRLHPFVGRDHTACVDVEPERDLLVAFPASAPHEVLPVRCPSNRFMDSRFAVNGWIRRA